MMRVVAETQTLYEFVGGMPAFRKLVEEFYDRVEEDGVLRPLYPESLDEPRERLTLFLAQYFGGPSTYSEKRGHPRLRMRHFPFPIGRRERDAWVRNMTEALRAAAIPEPARSQMQAYFEETATFLINQEDVPLVPRGDRQA